VFHFSRVEQVVLVALLALLLTGAGLLIYVRGERAGQGGVESPLFVEAPAPPAAHAHAPKAGPAPEAGGPTEAGGPSPGPATQPPGKGPAPSLRGEGVKPSPSSPIRLNSSGERELEALPGIGPVLASRIVQYREQLTRERGHGFESVDELLNVPGIGSRRLAAVRELVAL
jgi:hypothetical protein